MKKITFLLLFLSANAFSSVCTQHASLLVTLKLKDMLSAYGGRFMHESHDFNSLNGNPFTYEHLCKKDEIEETMTHLKREYFHSCDLKSVEDALDVPAESLIGERVETILSKFINANSCSPKDAIKLEENISHVSMVIEKELLKSKSNITEVCQNVRSALEINYELKRKCDL